MNRSVAIKGESHSGLWSRWMGPPMYHNNIVVTVHRYIIVVITENFASQDGLKQNLSPQERANNGHPGQNIEMTNRQQLNLCKINFKVLYWHATNFASKV